MTTTLRTDPETRTPGETLSNSASVRTPKALASPAVAGIFLIALVTALFFGRGFFLPVILSIIVALILRPMVRLLHSWHVPEAIGAAVVLVIALGGAATAVVSVYEPAMEWAKRAPGTLHRVEIKLRELRKPVDDVGRAAEQVEKITKMDEEEVPSVQIQGEGVNSRLLKYTVGTIGSVVVMIFLLYFVLATGGQFLHKLSALLARKTKHGGDPSLVAETEQHVSRYLFTVATINVGLGVVIALVMWALGMPNPLLWGLIATVLNFIPYLGAVTGVAVTAVVAIVTFDDSRCITVPLAYAACTSLEGMLITPMILGRRFKLDPVVVFLWLVFWGWLWGIGGALLAMPMLVILRIASEKIPTLSPVADVLGVSRPRQSVQPH